MTSPFSANINPNSVVPNANAIYLEGREAYKAGISRKSNPYMELFLKEIEYTWTSEDIWNLGWDLEEELNEQSKSTN